MKDVMLSGGMPKQNTIAHLFVTKRNIIIEIISFLLVLLFMYAAVSKLLDYQSFKVQLSKSPFITQFAGITSWALPIGEILVGLALTFKRTRLIGLYASLFLMTMFTAEVFYLKWIGKRIFGLI